MCWYRLSVWVLCFTLNPFSASIKETQLHLHTSTSSHHITSTISDSLASQRNITKYGYIQVLPSIFPGCPLPTTLRSSAVARSFGLLYFAAVAGCDKTRVPSTCNHLTFDSGWCFSSWKIFQIRLRFTGFLHTKSEFGKFGIKLGQNIDMDLWTKQIWSWQGSDSTSFLHHILTYPPSPSEVEHETLKMTPERRRLWLWKPSLWPGACWLCEGTVSWPTSLLHPGTLSPWASWPAQGCSIFGPWMNLLK